ncbi:hypothetical protein SF06_24300 [Pseudomonas flexibilis]|uniref:Uncharacterized protein n=1 Tax=Pseudomonas flexibilis TaxID=706570 RepID=A0A1N6RAN9_9PSED|nr:hypothetical protein [Pseudomonas flexibilis]KHL68622.1 hypothetical protein SF06_24300 [Pseudomonas flexibilis]SIQ25893.1 hypothetical protein SAMN05421672_104186 [Pseudomonas flexibilis]
MFVWLLIVTLAVSAAVCFLVARIFDKPIGNILARLVSGELGSAWHRYITFAIYVVGISGGVRIWALEQYVTPRAKDEEIIELNTARWVLEVYRTIIETLQGIAWMLLVFFIFALIAYVILRGFELRHARKEQEKQ